MGRAALLFRTLILGLLLSIADLHAKPPDIGVRAPSCEALLAAANEPEFHLRSSLLTDVGQYRPGLWAEMNAAHELTGVMGNEYELPMAKLYAKFLQRVYEHHVLLLPSFDGLHVPSFDGVVFDGSGKPVINVSFKTLISSSNTMARAERAIGDLKKSHRYDHSRWAEVMSVSTKILESEMLRPTLRITAEVLASVAKKFRSHFRKFGGSRVEFQVGMWLRLHKFYRVFGLQEKRRSHVVVLLRSDMEFPSNAEIGLLRKRVGLGDEGVEQVTFLRENEVLEVSADNVAHHWIP